MKTFLILLLSLLGFSKAAAVTVSDIAAAVEYCDTATLQRIEGIWELTTAECKVLICSSGRQYKAVILESDDARLLPGNVLATIEPSAHPDQFKFTFASGMKWNVECMATLSSDDTSLQIERPRHRLRLSPYMLLRRFWGLFRFDSDNPVDRLKQGMRRIYPNGIDHKSNGFRIRYL